MPHPSLLTLVILSVVVAGIQSAQADYRGPDKVLSKKANQELFEQYCVGQADSLEIPDVNYANKDVKRAAKILSNVSEKSYHFYSDIKRMYVSDDDKIPKNISKSAHTFLKILCGEFRDRASLIEAKIAWIHSMVMPGKGKQKKIELDGNVWAQMTGDGYAKWLAISDAVWNAKREARKTLNIEFGKNNEAETPVDGFSVCETKFIFNQYIAKDKEFDDYESYAAELGKFAEKCTKDDRDDYYDFRGDSNFKPNSPESNAMIWHSQSIAKNCRDLGTAKTSGFSSEFCQQYFTKPFLNRYNAARSALSTWLLRHTSVDDQFESDENPVIIHPILGEDIGQKPYRYSFDGETILAKFIKGLDLALHDFGFNGIMGLDSEKPNSELAYKRLRDAVNRHTNWYHSGYKDGFQISQTQFYSPFAATSYEMSQSDKFTAPGFTVPGAGDGRKHWMFVFRVNKKKWYNTESLRRGVNYDPDSMWIDETSFGTTSLADEERAWDRLGTPLEGELDTIIYLHNLDENGGVVGDDVLE